MKFNSKTKSNSARELIKRGNELHRSGKFDKAVESYKQLSKLIPYAFIAYQKIGDILVEQKKFEEAIQNYKEALKINDNLAYLHYILGKTLIKKGHLKEALHELEIAVDQTSNCPKKYLEVLKLVRFKIEHNTSVDYWEERYAKGGHSGFGSYYELAKFKASTLNQLVEQEKINSVIDFGCGDGNQLKFFQFPEYIGLDVSKTVIQQCQKQFQKDSNKSFFLYDPMAFFDRSGLFTVELAISLDVIFHLIEDEIYWKYINDLFSCAQRFVVIYAWDYEDLNYELATHVRPRHFTKDIENYINGWTLTERIENPYSVEKYGDKYGSPSVFCIYQPNY